MRKLFAFLIILMLFVVSSTCALADDWICPNCGRVNSDEMNFCGNCRTEKTTPPGPAPSASINAWVCSSCDHICPEEDNFCTRCSAEHCATDTMAILLDRPILEEIYMPPVSIQRISCSHYNDSATVYYTPNVEGRYYFWVEDQTNDFSGKMLLYDNNDRKLRANDFYDNDPGFAYRLTAGETYGITVKVDNSNNPDFTLCIGEPREPAQINARVIIQDSVDFYGQENTYLFVPQTTGEYRLDVTEMQNGQEIDLTVKDELGYTIKSSYDGITMGHGISFGLEAGKLYYIIAEQRTGWYRANLGYYKLQLSSPNPTVSVSGCNAVGDYMYYQYQKNTYEFTAPETGTYAFPLTVNASCDFSVSILDEQGYTVGNSGYSTSCRADLTANRSYQIIVEQRSGTGDYSLFIEKK